MGLGFRLPFQRRRSRWERLRDTVTSRRELRARLAEARHLRETLPEAAHLRDALPDPSALMRRAQPLVERVAAARHDLGAPQPPAFLQGGIERATGALGRRRPSLTERLLNAGIPLWAALALAGGALLVGFALGQAAARPRRSQDAPDLEAVAPEIKQRWPAVHDDDIREARGDLKRLSSVIGERTGEDARSVRERLSAITAGQSSNGQS